MSYNSTAEIENAITSRTAQKLFTDSGVYSATAFTQALDQASAFLDAALSTAGYSTPVATSGLATGTLNLLKLLECAVFVRWAFPRKGVPIPQQWREIIDSVLPGIVNGSVPLPGVSPASSTAVGGALWSSSSSSVTGSIAPVFTRSNSDGDDPLGGY